ncbi:polysaccharide biosynthesis tyrosine autokinase [Egicoccus sp. AB-alg2]|uniref:polysaccharide biosynthesis tyrosine autokinase n=1 Tax=Egicoccus sp. AB-alg2 TaxID=3242693 RepID=UPI00359DA8B3
MERDDTISLQDYLVVLRRQRWLILTVVVLVVVAALAASFAQTPVYEAEAEVAVEPVRRSQDFGLEQLLQPQRDLVQTERLVVTSRPVAERVVEELGLPDTSTALEDLRVEAVGDTRVVRIVAADTDPAAAVERANAFADAYLDYRRDEALDNLLAARASLDQRANELREEIAALEEEAGELDEVQRDALLAQLAQLVGQGAEVGGGGAAIIGGGSVLTPAELPEGPVSPRPLRTGALALVLGVLLGVGLAFLRDHIDDVIRDEPDFRRATGGRPILGRIPNWNDPEGGDRLATMIEPTSFASEAYRELSAGVRFLLVAHEEKVACEAAGDQRPLGRSIMLASATAGDGKTSTAANLAVAAARVGLRTVLVDADLRRATVGRRFGLGKTTGLSDVLLSGGRIKDHVVAVGVDNLRVLPAGTIPPNPTELLASPAMRALEHELLGRADLVIYDTPAVLAVPDALELGRHVDLAILVARAGTTGRRQLTAAIERLEQVGTEVAGSVLNGIDSKSDGYYYSYYYRDVPEQPAETKRGPLLRRGDKTPPPPARPAVRPSNGDAAPTASAPRLDDVETSPFEEQDPSLDEPLFPSRRD